jgi:S-disulfanyl-L-cysteine oxidoreductase SoxD
MSSWKVEFMAAALSLAAFGAAAQQAAAPAAQDRFPGIGRAATPAEVKAWDIDVRPDFQGLPKGSGSVAKGQEVWEAKCASCHGVFGESNEVFAPIVGGTTAEDIRTGRVANLMRADYPGRTTLMKLSQVSTLWDYINRAMPWNAPKSLTVEEVYATTAFILNMGGIVPDNFTLSDGNIAEVQKRLPNRNGKTTAHAMWPGPEFGGAKVPDVRGTACMADCPAVPKVASLLPDHARNAHGNLAEQNRLVGAQRGANTTAPPGTPAVRALPVAARAAAPTASPEAAAARALAQKNSCTACHAADQKLVGPSWAEIAKKHPGNVDYLSGKIRAGGVGAWGNIPMPPQSLSEADARTLGAWLAQGAP